ncbi:hypothetical protein CPC08DRAFT_243308 [Agrocybe pediades]|nr:hypothetical protein CPC08DRAFT_243308 [Agrocybe pediades]
MMCSCCALLACFGFSDDIWRRNWASKTHRVRWKMLSTLLSAVCKSLHIPRGEAIPRPALILKVLEDPATRSNSSWVVRTRVKYLIFPYWTLNSIRFYSLLRVPNTLRNPLGSQQAKDCISSMFDAHNVCAVDRYRKRFSVGEGKSIKFNRVQVLY